MTSRLRSILKGHKSAVARLISKFEAFQEDPVDQEELQTIETSLRQKLQTVTSIHEQILDSLGEDDSDQIETEILDHDEYTFNLQTKIKKVTTFRQVTFTNLNVNSLPFSVPVSGETSQTSSHTEFLQCTNPSNQSSAPPTTSHSSVYHRLPKLDLPRFDGDILQWPSFWDSYDSAIHSNLSLSNVQKFNYLKSSITGEASHTIAGFALTNDNYYRAVDLLQDRFGQKEKIIDTYMTLLLNVPAPVNSVVSLRKFYDTTETYIRGLESLGKNEDSYGSLLTPVILQKLPQIVRNNITRAHGSLSWRLNDLMCELLKEVKILDAGNILTPQEDFVSTATFLTKSDHTRLLENQKTQNKSNRFKECVFCQGNHSCTECLKIKDHEQRMRIVRRKKLCFNCLGNHKVSVCKSRFTCKKCSGKHHTSLCDGKSTEEKPETTSGKDTHTSVLHSAQAAATGAVLLKTAVSMVTSSDCTTSANILFDEGSQSSFITKTLADKLQLKPTGSESICLSGFGDTTRHVRHLDTATIYLQTAADDIPIHVLIVPEISVPLKTYQQHVGQFGYLRKLKLAHPVSRDGDFNIEILIGADHYWDIIQDNIIRGNGPTAISSKIGYLLSGPLNTSEHKTKNTLPLSVMKVITSHATEEVNLEKFWQIESFGIEQDDQSSHISKVDEYSQHYQKNNITQDDNQYVAKLPWKPDHPTLPSNEVIARRRTVSVVNRLKKEPKLLQIYGQIIKEQEDRGFVERVPDNELHTDGKVHFIPHHPVKKDSATTPIRIVYDCSCRSSKDSPCLNDCLMNTPPRLNELTSILLQFRQRKFAVSSDIEKAFLSVQLHHDDRDVTRFFWLSNPDDPNSKLQVYRFRSVLFGATCSPFILDAVIRKHLNNHKCDTTDLLRKCLYVDNILTSVSDEITLLNFYNEAREILKQATFNLRSWSSNSQTLRSVTENEGTEDRDELTKVLGMRWNATSDILLFPQKTNKGLPDDKLITKREVLKQMSTVYDPLGLLSPVTVRGKMLMQLLWKRQFAWDEILPNDIITDWVKIRNDIAIVTTTQFNRSYFQDSFSTDATLHVFSDASIKAYGACAYLVSGDQSILCMAKNRVAPLKQLSIPKLELCAALMGAKLCKHIRSTLDCKNVYLWSDSQIVLSWIVSTKILPGFVFNRVKAIRELTQTTQWRYCQTSSNPADLLSRGLTHDRFHNNALWLHGPSWLTEKTEFPTSDMNSFEHQSTPEEPTKVVLTTAREITSTQGILQIVNLDRYSSYHKLIRVYAYVLRFINNCLSSQKTSGSLTAKELNTATINIIRHVQHKEFPEVIRYLTLQEKHSGSKPTIVRQLDLYLDTDKVLRCGGRLSNAPLNDYARFPYLLPSKSRLTDLIIKNAHAAQLHAGKENIVTYLRQKFWIPNIRQRVRHVIRTCVTCRKVSSKPYKIPDPPPLPKDRLLESPPFTVTGVDFTGALTVKSHNQVLQKAYICLFTCANTRAIHLEIVPNMTAESFMLALRRFASRRSLPKVIMSDNALAYIATAKVLKEELFGQNAVVWKFIPQHAPWYGGWWERLIGITKSCIKKTLGKALVSMEVLQTIITEVESIVNDRPLTHTSSDYHDDEPLTPAHLLYGRRITAPTFPDEIDYTTDDLTQKKADKLYRFKSATLQHFWTRWKHEYVTGLREFHKTSGQQGDIVAKGDIIQIHDDNLPRNRWLLGVVEDLIVGNDGQVRAARVKSRSGMTTRPIAKLYPLELHETRRRDVSYT